MPPRVTEIYTAARPEWQCLEPLAKRKN
jgi:hypothetical protein